MKNINKVTKVEIGPNLAGTAEYQETGMAIEINETVYTIEKEDAFNDTTETLYFKEEINALEYLKNNS